MTAKQLAALIEKAVAQAEQQHLDDLAAAWRKAMDQSAVLFSDNFALTADANWQPPHGNPFQTTAFTALIAKIAATLGEQRLKILRTLSKALRVRVTSLDQVARANDLTAARLEEAVGAELRRSLQQSHADGLTANQAADQLDQDLRRVAPARAEALARTELTMLANDVSLSAAQGAGMNYKAWASAMDDRVRDSHAEANGQIVPIHEQFVVCGGQRCNAPGDPSLSDDCLLNCRCTLLYSETLAEMHGLLASAGSSTLSEMATAKQRARRAARRNGQRSFSRGEALLAAAIPVHHTGVIEGAWDGNAALGRCSSASDFRSICAWVDSNGDASQRQSYKFPHHANPGGPANINGVRNALARLPQASIPSGDVAGVRAHLEAHLNDFNRRQGTASIVEQNSLAAADEFDSLRAEAEKLQSLPTGVKYCTLGGKPGYTGGRLCYVHDGTPEGKQKSIKRAQADVGKAALLASARPVPFSGVAAVEGVVASDNSPLPRVVLPGSLNWRELPRPLMAQTKTAEGHDGAEISGKIDEFSRQGSGKKRPIAFSGEFTTPFGIEEIAPMVEDKTLRFVSLDLGEMQTALVDRKSLALVPEEEASLDQLRDGQYALGVTEGTIMAATLVPTPALPGTEIALTASGDGDDEVWTVVVPVSEFTLGEAEALTAAPAPVHPPRHWFETQEPPGKVPLTVLEDGRVYGHLATWDSCHVGFLPSCVPPPKSPSNYAYFHACELDTDEGDTVTVGKLMFSPGSGGHADRRISAQKAAEYYDQTGMCAAYLRVTDGQHGIWAAGSLNPDLSDKQREQMRRELRLHPPSGDWRPVNGSYELICALAVAVPGFPVPRSGAKVTIVASADGFELAEAIIASSGPFDADESALVALDAEGLLDSELVAERRLRTLAARAEGMESLASLID